MEGFTTIPIIDISALITQDADPAAVSAASQQLHHACRDVGFFYVRNHGVPEDLAEGVLLLSRRWFALPASTKEELSVSPSSHYRGYQALGVNVTRYDGGFQRDWHEAIDLFREEDAAALQASGLPCSKLHGLNPWPHHIPELEAALRLYVQHCLRLGSAIMKGIAIGLGLPPATFQGDADGRDSSYWLLRSIMYPPLSLSAQHQAAAASSPTAHDTTRDGGHASPHQHHGAGHEASASPPGDGQPDANGICSTSDRSTGKSPAGGVGEGLAPAAAQALAGSEVERTVQLSCGEHTDYGLLTIVNQEQGVTALQVKNSAGAWVDAHPIPGTFVCNIGDMMKVWTNGLYMPTLHRVINGHPTLSRVSIPFFYEPAFEAVVRPLPQVCAIQGAAEGLAGPAPERFAAIRYGTHLEHKIFSNFESLEAPA